MDRKQRLTEDLTRSCLYGLNREYLEALQLKSILPAERKALVIIYALLCFAQGKRRFPREKELPEFLSDVLDRNLGILDLTRKWELNLDDDPIVDDPEKYYLETLELLEQIRRFEEGWFSWIDG